MRSTEQQLAMGASMLNFIEASAAIAAGESSLPADPFKASSPLFHYLRTGPGDRRAGTGCDARQAVVRLLEIALATPDRVHLRNTTLIDLIAIRATALAITKPDQNGVLIPLAGFYHYFLTGGSVHVRGVFCLNSVRRRGLMKSLMAREFERLAKANAALSIEADVGISECNGLNLDAYFLFRKLGFCELEVREFPIGHDTHIEAARGRPGVFLALRMRTGPGWVDKVSAIIARDGSIA